MAIIKKQRTKQTKKTKVQGGKQNIYAVLSGNSANPVVIIIFFAVIIGLSLLAVKSGDNSGTKNIKKLYAGKVKDEAKFESGHHVKESYGDCFISEEGEFVVNLPSGSLAGYKV